MIMSAVIFEHLIIKDLTKIVLYASSFYPTSYKIILYSLNSLYRP